MSEQKAIPFRKLIFLVCLLLQTAYCWWCFIEAKNLPYDENYGMILHAIAISVAAGLLIIVQRTKWFGNWKLSSIYFWIWFAIGSPLIYILCMIYYNELFGPLAT